MQIDMPYFSANLVACTSGVELAVALRSVVAEAELTKNAFFSRQRSEATSRFYNILANCVESFSMPDSLTLPQQHGPVLPQPHLTGDAFPQPTTSIMSHPPVAGIHPRLGPAYPRQPGIFIPHHPGGVVYYHPGGEFPLQPVNVGNGPRLPPIISPVARPTPRPRQGVPSRMPPPPLPGRIGTARGKSVEEARKVRDYGFPPLPGSRPGTNALVTKRKLGE